MSEEGRGELTDCLSEKGKRHQVRRERKRRSAVGVVALKRKGGSKMKARKEARGYREEREGKEYTIWSR